MKPKESAPMVPRHVSGGKDAVYLHESMSRAAIGSRSFLPADASFESLQALQDLVSELGFQSSVSESTSKPRQSATSGTMDDVFIRLLAISNCDTRAEAVKSLVQRLAREFPKASVHAGIGGKNLRKFHDPAFGWLGAESELFRNFAQTWQSHHTIDAAADQNTPAEESVIDASGSDAGFNSSVSPIIDAPRSSFEIVSPSEILIPLRRPGEVSHRGDDCILLRLSGEALDANLASAFDRWSEPLAAIIWGRPSWVVPKWVYLHGNRRKIALAAVAVLMSVLLFPTPYRVKAKVRIEPQSPRIVSAPFEAIIEDVSVQPGDEVKAGQTLITLDGRPLRLERQSLDAEIYQSAKQKDISLAAGRIAEAQQAQLKYQQLLRRRDLIDRRLEQLLISSPIDGVVVSGDLRRSVGASLELGRVLMEIAPLDRVLVEIAIPEYEISMVKENASSRIRVDASGSPTIHQPITEIYPAGELREDEVVFISLIELDNRDGEFRPGMTGKATVYGDHRPFIWPYIRRAIDQVTWMIGL